MGDVKLLSRWDGWCDPCGTERPLLLTARGEFGPRAWLSGVEMEDRTLVLTCALCGEWQLCPWDEEFPEESLALVEAGPAVVQSTQAEVVTKRGIFARSKAVSAEPTPARVRAEAEIPKITDGELLRSIARAEARAQQVATVLAAAAAAAQAAVEPVLVQAEPAAPQRRTAAVRHIVLQPAYGPARATAVPALPVPRAAAVHDHQDDALHLLAGGLDLIAASAR